MARNVQGPDWPTPNEALRERMPARLQLNRAEVSYVTAPAAPMMPWRNEAPVVTMPPRQCLPRARAEISRSGPWGDVTVAGEGRARIYVMPFAVPPTPVSYPAHQAGCELVDSSGHVLITVNALARPVAPTTRSASMPPRPGTEKIRPREFDKLVQSTAKTVVSAPRSFVQGQPKQEAVPVLLSCADALSPPYTALSPRSTAMSRPSPPAGLVGPNLEVPLNKGVEKLSAMEAQAKRDWESVCLVVDVRSADRASGHIQVPELVQKFSKEKLVASARTGIASRRVAVLEGGYRGWEGQRLPVVREQPMDAHGQACADKYALSMGRRVAGAGA
ncbi:hypothetical protein AK812_SmicGene43170 [Symbiodinium microadriaticum]|uniref:Rhodanese domain-containing protein n=1 Tax=Symbiodinium microadriaticum TaxID=2951 RepID=A0A1Q9C1P3_SYMMI|nr:hypothetical protein AK812_SmicGene43170 [Symbiodinium microadriaticum]